LQNEININSEKGRVLINNNGVNRFSLIKQFSILIRKLVCLLAKANYHEYPIVDEKGEIIAHEFFTTHGEALIRINKSTQAGENTGDQDKN
jgi:hypothetical protein